MSFLNLSGSSPIGLDIGFRHLRAVQFSGSAENRRVVAAMSQARAQSGGPIQVQEVRQLRESLSQDGLVGRRLVLAVPEDLMLTESLEIPPRGSGAPVEQIATMELARIHRCDPQDIEIAFWDLPASSRAGQGAEVMAAACPHAAANELLDLFESQGLSVVALDAYCLAMARGVAGMFQTDKPLGIILDVGWQRCRLVAVRAGVVIYQRNLAEGGLGTLSDRLETKLDLDASAASQLIQELGPKPRDDDSAQQRQARAEIRDHFDAIAEEVRVSITYIQHRYPDSDLDRIGLVGGGAAISGLVEFLTEILHTDVTTASLSDWHKVGRSVRQELEPSMALATGLALHPGAAS